MSRGEIQFRFLAKGVLLAAILAGGMGSVAAVESPRERLSLDDHWRFTLGDPAGVSAGLIYEVRPEVKDKQDDRAADAEPTAAEKIAVTNQLVLKPWILPTGNAFIKDPAQRHVRPEQAAPTNVSYCQATFDDRAWQIVNLPHDWAIAGPFNTKSGQGVGGGMGRLPSPGIGWYRRQLDITASDAGKTICLDVDGAMAYAMVWLNGHLVGGWPYGYASWRVNLTPYIVLGGTNQLAIRLDNPPDSSRWYPGGGIYRNVWLTKTHAVHVAQWGTQLTTPEVSRESASVNLRVTLDNDTPSAVTVSVATEIFRLNAAGKPTGAAVAQIPPARMAILPNGSAVSEGKAMVTNPKLWGPPPMQQPNRYVAVTTVARNGVVVDRYETRFGIREVRFDSDRGVLVNGERIPLRGVNQHHDLGALGAAFNERAAQRQLEILRDLGCNAIRTSHNPPAPEWLELTDEMGFLVVDEIFDCWERKKTPLDFHLIFPDWHEPDLRAFLRRDRNHPSVILWSVGNEVGEQYTGAAGAKVAQVLCDMAHEEDATRPTTAAMNWAKADMPLPAVLDVIGLNYQGEGIRDTLSPEEVKGIRTPPQYPAFRQAFPNKLIFSTETAAALSSRGTYLFPVFAGLSSPVKIGQGGDPQRQYVSAYELYAADFGSSADKVFAAQDRHPYVAGEFVWSGWDYLGEPTPYYGARSSYFGIIDLAGFKKDRFYLYQSRWRPDLPIAHILPHWNWSERVGLVTPVHVFTSGDEAELFLNGQSQDRKKKGPYEYRLRWDGVVYQPGELKVVAYKQGRPWATDVVKTAGQPGRLKLVADRTTIRADGRDLSFITVSVTDKQGVMVPTADNKIHFAIEGPGEIVATDNGDPTSFESFASTDRSAFNGLCLVIVRTQQGQAGRIKVTARADGLQSGTAVLKTTGN